MFWNNFKLTKLVKIVVFCTLYSVSPFANLSKVTLPKLRNQHGYIFTNENSILSWTSPGSPLTVLFLVQTQPRRPHWSSLSPLILPSELWLFLSLSLFFMTLTFLKSSSQPFDIPQFGLERLFFPGETGVMNFWGKYQRVEVPLSSYCIRRHMISTSHCITPLTFIL